MIRFKKYKDLEVEKNIDFSVGAGSSFNGMRIYNDGGEKGISPAKVRIGRNFHCGKGCVIRTSDHDYQRGYPMISGLITGYKSEDVTIGNHVWLGDDVLIMKGVTIGQGAVIQSRSVVVSDIPALAIAGGHPCKVFAQRDPKEYQFFKNLDFTPVQSSDNEAKRAFLDKKLAEFKAAQNGKDLRGATSSTGADPDFLIVGGMKCGTSSLGRNLHKHPQIFLANDGGEVHFFDKKPNKARGIEWYRSQFPRRDGVRAYGDKTPSYIDIQHHSSLRKFLPNSKLVIILRDPVKRFQSHYNYFQRPKVREEIRNRYAKPFQLSDLEKTFDPRVFARGLYDVQIESLFRHFPKEQIHICFLEDFRDNEQGEYDRVYSFLGVDSIPVQADRFNVQDSYPYPLDKEAQLGLYQRYAPHNARLFQLLGLPERQDWKKYENLA